MDGVRLENGVGQAVLVKDIHDRELAAEGVATMAESHLIEFVGISLDEDRHAAIFQGRHGAGFIAKVGQAQDYPIVFSPVLLKETRVFAAFLRRFHRAETSFAGVQEQRPVAVALDGLLHFLARSGDQGFRKESAVSKVESKGK